jgi:hypothetical protein
MSPLNLSIDYVAVLYNNSDLAIIVFLTSTIIAIVKLFGVSIKSPAACFSSSSKASH